MTDKICSFTKSTTNISFTPNYFIIVTNDISIINGKLVQSI